MWRSDAPLPMCNVGSSRPVRCSRVRTRPRCRVIEGDGHPGSWGLRSVHLQWSEVVTLRELRWCTRTQRCDRTSFRSRADPGHSGVGRPRDRQEVLRRRLIAADGALGTVRNSAATHRGGGGGIRTMSGRSPVLHVNGSEGTLPPKAKGRRGTRWYSLAPPACAVIAVFVSRWCPDRRQRATAASRGFDRRGSLVPDHFWTQHRAGGLPAAGSW
jgi:hypothetical protein